MNDYRSVRKGKGRRRPEFDKCVKRSRASCFCNAISEGKGCEIGMLGCLRVLKKKYCIITAVISLKRGEALRKRHGAHD